MNQWAYAAAYQLYELATPRNGTAGVGQAAITDAAISYFNPAGMALLKNSQFMLGTQLILPYSNFSARSTTTIPGINGGNSGSLVPGADFYFVYDYSPKLKIGASLTGPAGGAMNLDDHWVGRYFVQQMTFYTLNLNPSLSYKVNDWLAIGGGVAMEYANLYQTAAIPTGFPIDGQLTIKTDNFSPGFNLGVFLTPIAKTQIGVAYRSQIIHKLHGTATFFNISESPNVSTKLILPANIIASLSQKVTDKFTLLGELGWANWSAMVNTTITIQGVSSSVPQNWHDTYRLGLGGRYQFSPQWLFQLGSSYDSSPTSSSKRTPNLPMDRQIRVGTGVEYLLIKAVKLGVSYEYINFGKANINNISSTGILAGSYSRNFAHVFQASLNVDL